MRYFVWINLLLFSLAMAKTPAPKKLFLWEDSNLTDPDIGLLEEINRKNGKLVFFDNPLVGIRGGKNLISLSIARTAKIKESTSASNRDKLCAENTEDIIYIKESSSYILCSYQTVQALKVNDPVAKEEIILSLNKMMAAPGNVHKLKRFVEIGSGNNRRVIFGLPAKLVNSAEEAQEVVERIKNFTQANSDNPSQNFISRKKIILKTPENKTNIERKIRVITKNESVREIPATQKPLAIPQQTDSGYPVMVIEKELKRLDRLSKIPYYSEVSEREKRMVSIQSGIFYRRDLTRVEISNGVYVMDAKGKFFVQLPPGVESPRIKHTSLLAGEPVAMAGLITIKNGILVKISDLSGHYAPGAGVIDYAIEELLKNGVKYKFEVETIHGKSKYLPPSSTTERFKKFNCCFN